jgi:hypothetical protein
VRLLLAGIFVIACLCTTVLLLGPLMEKGPLWAVVPIILTVMFGSIFLSLLVFNRGVPDAGNAWKLDLEKQGLLVSTSFQIIRSLQVEELEDEGSHYFLQLTDNRVLFLSGQYLYDYEPLDDIPRTFPSSAFTVRRHKDEGFAVDIICQGEVLEPEACAPAFDAQDFSEGKVPQDGQILAVDFNQIKAERLKWS